MLEQMDLGQENDVTEFLKSRFVKKAKHKTEIQAFKYERPVFGPGKVKAAVHLATTDLVFAVVQVFDKAGGEVIVHSHAGMDGFWMVLSGCAHFHNENNETYVLGPLQGLVIPRGVRYWFEAVGDEALELLQVDAMHPGIPNTVEFGGLTEAQVAASQSPEKNAGFFDARDTAPPIKPWTEADGEQRS